LAPCFLFFCVRKKKGSKGYGVFFLPYALAFAKAKVRKTLVLIPKACAPLRSEGEGFFVRKTFGAQFPLMQKQRLAQKLCVFFLQGKRYAERCPSFVIKKQHWF